MLKKISLCGRAKSQHLSRIFCLFLFLFVSSLSLADITILPSYRPNAAELIPIIQSQLSPDSSVQVYQNQIILNASAEETQKIKQLLEKLDGKGRQLLISIKLEQSGSAQQKVSHREAVNQNQNRYGQQTIRATEGYPSFISIGQSHLLTNSETGQWYNVSTGFYASAYIVQDHVNIRIEQQQADHQQIQQLLSQVQGKLGQWIKIGAINQTQMQRNSAGSMQQQSSRILYLKVDLLDKETP